VETRTPTKTSAGDPRWLVSRTYTDSNGRVVATMDPIVVENANAPTDASFSLGNDSIDASTEYRVSQTLYDPAGRVIESRRLAGVDITIAAVTVPGATVPIYNTDFIAPTGAALAAAILSRSQTIHDGAGRVSQTVTYDTADPNDPFNAVLNRTWFEYDAAGRQTAVIQAVDLDHDGTIDAPDTDSNGVPDSGTELVRITSEYDAAGRLKSTTDALGNTTWFEYDPVGRQTAVIAAAVVDPVTLDLVHPRTETVYDSLGRRTKSRENLTQTDPTDPSTVDASAVRETVYAYDDQGRLEQVDLPEITSSTTGSSTGVATYQYDYDVHGNQVLIRDPMDNDLSGTLNKETKFTYDHLGRQTSRTLPDGLTETMFYDDTPLSTLTGSASSVGLGQLEYTVDFQGRVTAYRYDNTPTGGGRLVATYFYDEEADYDPADPATDAAQSVLYTYDALGRQITITDCAFATPTTRSYDAEGRPTQIASPQGVINYEYNALGQLTRTYTGAADSNGTNNAGDGEEVTDTSYTYDALGRLKTVTVVERNDQPLQTQEETTYRYDANGNLDLEIRPGDIVTDYQYDALNRLDLQINFVDVNQDGVYNDGAAALRGQYDYTLRTDGQRQKVEETDDQGNVTTIDWVYDELGRLTEERYDFDPTDTDYDTIARYGFDLASNRVQLSKDLQNAVLANFTPDETTVYDYDQNDRLTREVFDGPSADTTTFYDYNGSEQTGQTVYNGIQETEPASGATKTTTYAYNVQGRLTTVTINDGATTTVTSYKYKDDGVRVEQTVQVDTDPAVTTVYHIDPLNHTGYAQVLEVGVDSSADGRLDVGEITTTFTFGLSVISQQAPDIELGETLHFLKDGHGSTRALANSAGNVVQSYSYDAYGNAIGFNPSAAYTSLLYNAEWFQANIGMQYLRARWYSASIGRFVSSDTFDGYSDEPLTFHKYLYGNANPIHGRDPSGLSVEFDAPKGILAHAVFSLYVSVTQRVPLQLVGATLSTVAGISGSQGALKPDFVDMRSKEYFELKPASHILSGSLQRRDYVTQMSLYDAALQPTYRRGTSSRLVPYEPGGLKLGIFTDDLGDSYLVRGWPEARRRLVPSGNDGRGLIYYSLSPLDDTPIPPLWIDKGSPQNGERFEVFREEYRPQVDLHFDFHIAASTALQPTAAVGVSFAAGIFTAALIVTAFASLGAPI
jgi:RHS repeat-associated protein